MGRTAQDNLVGIDLGTTFSVIAHLDEKGAARTLPNRDGDPLTPSAIYLDGENALVGKAARAAAAGGQSARVAMCIKRDIGQPHYSRPISGQKMRPETLSAIILRKLKQDAERHIGPISKAVITVPAFFDERRRKATEDAGRIAGLEVVDVINEPTAAALAFAINGQRGRGGPADQLELPGGQITVLVYDLGGGTFDVTVVRLSAKRFEILATDGAVRLGGTDWDECILNFMADECQRQSGVNPLKVEDPDSRAKLLNTWGLLAERAKVLLSDLPEVAIEFSHDGRMLHASLSRSRFEELSQHLVDSTQSCTNLVVAQAGLDWEQIDDVLLVGGSTRMPMVKHMLCNLRGKDPDDSLDADQVVAHGAAIHCGIVAAKGRDSDLVIDDRLRSELEDIEILPVNAYSLGVAAEDRNPRSKHKGQLINAKVIEKNSELPIAKSRIFGTKSGNVTHVSIKILEGEPPLAADNIELGTCRISNLPPNLPSGSPVQVRLSYGKNCRIQVMALDMTGGQFAQADIVRKDGLTEEDILREAEYVRNLKIK